MSAANGTEASLGELRARLARVDRSLVLALRDRADAQREVLAFKEARLLPLVDPEQEAVVRRRARAWALEYGVDEALAVQVVDAALESGKRRFVGNGPSRRSRPRSDQAPLRRPSRLQRSPTMPPV